MDMFSETTHKKPWDLMKEVRYTSLLKTFPAEAEELFEAAEENAKWRYAGYQRLSKMEY